VAADYDFERRRELVNRERGYSEQHWQQFVDLGCLGVAFSEADGGYGAKATDLMAVTNRCA
jgi:alkylation response protein AidB-like acyl-CoA dehydrogenase